MTGPRPPNAATSLADLTFHMREVCSVALKPFSETLWLFGNTVNRESVAVRVDGFRPFFFVDYDPNQLTDIDEWVAMMNNDMRPFESCRDIITRADVTERVPVVGFTNNMPRKLLRIEYDNEANIWRLRKHFGKPVQYGNKLKQLELYHDDWSVESHFLHATGLRMQSWVRLTRRPVAASTKQTSCMIECHTDYRSMVALEEAPVVVPPMLVCAVRLRAEIASGDLAPSALRGDPLASIATSMYWMGEGAQRVWETVFSRAPADNDDSRLLAAFEAYVQEHDVDILLHLSDFCQDLEYLVQRCPTLKLSKFSKFGNKLRTRNGVAQSVDHPGRTRIDMRLSLEKMMITPKLDGFTLQDAAFHEKLLRSTPDESFRKHSFHPRGLDLAELERQSVEEVNVLVKLELANFTILGFVEISAASFTQLTVSCCSGQQIRVYKKLIAKFHAENLLANRSQLKRVPVIVNRTQEESSYPDPEELPNVPPPGRSKARLPGKKRARVTSLTKVPTVVVKRHKGEAKRHESKKEHAGGRVCDPKAGFYAREEEATFTFDFSSLYPSIIRGNRICYMRICFDRTMLDDSSYVKEYVPIRNDKACVVFIKGRTCPETGVFTAARTILPETISEVCEERTRTRKQMKTVTDEFLYAVLDAKQLSCKVFQNAVYGFTGVERNAKFAFPLIMATVCRIGQSMIKRVQHKMIADYGGYVVYGDTDSVMVQFPCPPELRTREQKLDYFYGVSRAAAADCSAMFPPPNALQFETMKLPYYLREKKKNYAALEYSPDDWHRPPNVAIKGLPFKKRDRCMFVRKVGSVVMEMVLGLQIARVGPYICEQMELLVDGRVPIKDLVITCLMNDRASYKSGNLIQLKTVDKIEARTGVPVQTGARLSYVVVRGSAPQYERGEDPGYVQENKIPLDYEYYLETQFLSAIRPLVEFHTHEVHIEAAAKKCMQKIQRSLMKIKSLDKKKKVRL